MADRAMLLIVNADDLGLRHEITDAILRCWDLGAISSATAMVHMADSARAARLASARGLPTGLHLNMTTPFTDRAAPPEVAARQDLLCRHFAEPHRRWLPAPRLRGEIGLTIAEQLSEYERLFHHPPTHVDGHEHIQGCPAVFASSALSATAMRLIHTFERGERPLPHRLARQAINAGIRGRFRTTARFWSLRDLHPDLGGRGLEERLLAVPAPVEVMVHADWPDEHAVLTAPNWRAALASRRLGSYADLASR